jgi:hypothetical protein
MATYKIGASETLNAHDSRIPLKMDQATEADFQVTTH